MQIIFKFSALNAQYMCVQGIIMEAMVVDWNEYGKLTVEYFQLLRCRCGMNWSIKKNLTL